MIYRISLGKTSGSISRVAFVNFTLVIENHICIHVDRDFSIPILRLMLRICVDRVTLSVDKNNLDAESVNMLRRENESMRVLCKSESMAFSLRYGVHFLSFMREYLLFYKEMLPQQVLRPSIVTPLILYIPL